MDNCEHVLAGCRRLVDTVLRACPDVRFLTTSREKLGVEGEQVWPVPPLAYPSDGVPPSDALLAYDAAQLFLERAGRMDPSFSIGTENAADLVEVLQLLEGMPLAIELAAARVNVVGLSQMTERLRDQLAFLWDGQTPADTRHRSLR